MRISDWSSDVCSSDLQDVVLAISTRPWHPFRQHHHRLHRDHHTGLQLRLDILAQFHARFPTVVMAEHPEAVAVAERTVFQKVPLPVHFVELESDNRSEEHTSELQSLMRTSYAVFCL